MPNVFSRLVACLVVPCFLFDPSLAIAAGEPLLVHRSVAAVNQRLPYCFENQALTLRVVSVRTDVNRGWIWLSEKFRSDDTQRQRAATHALPWIGMASYGMILAVSSVQFGAFQEGLEAAPVLWFVPASVLFIGPSLYLMVARRRRGAMQVKKGFDDRRTSTKSIRALRTLPWILFSVLWVGSALRWFEHTNLYEQVTTLSDAPALSGMIYEKVSFTADDHTRLKGAYIPGRGGELPASESVIVYFHGNGDSIRDIWWKMQLLHDRLGLPIFVFDYRGYGESDGFPSERGITEDAVPPTFFITEPRSLTTIRKTANAMITKLINSPMK